MQPLCPMTDRSKRANIGVKTPFNPKGWEVLSAVVDSGATVPCLHPEDGKAYEVKESEASKNGVEYEVADGNTIPNLGEKLMAVMTPEGTLRGYKTQVAQVSSPLQSVRHLLASQHCVLFGLGPEGADHLIINKISGEVNRMRDDGTNYLQDLLVVPPDEVGALMQMIEDDPQGFGRQG